MDLEEIFSRQEYQIPIIFKSDDFKSEVSGLLTGYIDAMKSHGVSEEIVNKVRSFRKSCAYTLSNYLKAYIPMHLRTLKRHMMC